MTNLTKHNKNEMNILLDSIINFKILTTTGLEFLMKFPAEPGPSISVISVTVSLEGPSFVPSFATDADEDTPIIGSEANAGGGLRDSVVKETG